MDRAEMLHHNADYDEEPDEYLMTLKIISQDNHHFANINDNCFWKFPILENQNCYYMQER